MRWKHRLPIGDWRARAPAAVSIALGAVLLFDLLRSIMSLHGSALPGQVLPVVLPPKPRASPQADVRTIQAAHLFGDPAIADATDAANASETRRPLVLSGIIATSNPQVGQAILAESGAPAHAYRPGEQLVGGRQGRLYQVLVDRVVLEVDGKFETLRLPGERVSSVGGRVAPTEVVVRHVEAPPPPEEGPERPPMPTQAESTFQILHAARENATLGGMPLHPETRYQRSYGLRDGDILTAVNGVATSDAEALQNTLRSSTESLSLTVVRNGTPQTVNVPID